MRILQQLIGIILIFTFSGCASLSVKSDYDASASFSGLKTYGWLPAPKEVIDDPRVDWELLSSRIRTAVDRELSEKGFTRQTTGSPDFLIGFQATLDKKMTWQEMDREYGRRGGYPRWTQEVYDQGTLVLDVIDVESQKIIWSGSATDKVNFSLSPEKEEAEINEAVSKMLKEFPPK
jgi:hypothetical protein